MSFPERLLDSPFGKVTVWATSQDHVGVRTSGDINTLRKAGEPDSVIVVNKVPMTLRADIHPTKGKNWSPEIGESGWFLSEHAGLMLSKVKDNGDGTFSSLYPSHVSDAGRQKVFTVLLGWLVEWVASPEGQKLLAEAKLQRTIEMIGSIGRRLDKIDAETMSLRAERERLLATLAEVQAAAEAQVVTV